MSIPVVAKQNLDAYIPDTEIVVKIPEGTEGQILHELRGNVVTVQFDVPSLGPLRVNRDDLLLEDSLDVIIADMQRLLDTKGAEKAAHRDADDLLIRAIQIIAGEEDSAKANHLIEVYRQIPKHYV